MFKVVDFKLLTKKFQVKISNKTYVLTTVLPARHEKRPKAMNADTIYLYSLPKAWPIMSLTACKLTLEFYSLGSYALASEKQDTVANLAANSQYPRKIPH